MRYLLDSVILIDHFNGIDAATQFLESHEGDLAVSAITRAEVLAGFSDAAVELGTSVLDSFQFLPMDVAICDAAAKIRRQTKLKLPDAIQAAFATFHSMKLVTRNTRDFPATRFSFVVVPYRLA
ncbi:MAG: type II toxin-antitoxin system VapC family toxin [Betaproteobacteria bacterium]|nr:type II toxin-antitoxin system VapC family toxin [Betaproteobacteria bacterium]